MISVLYNTYIGHRSVPVSKQQNVCFYWPNPETLEHFLIQPLAVHAAINIHSLIFVRMYMHTMRAAHLCMYV